MVRGRGRKDTKGCTGDIFENGTSGEDRGGRKGGEI